MSVSEVRRSALPVDFAYAYASVLGWSVRPGRYVKDGVCTCGQGDCSRPGAHPMDDAAQEAGGTINPDLIRRWWSHWPVASVLTVPRGFVGVSVPALWGTRAVDRTALAETPVIDGRGAFTFLSDVRGAPHGGGSPFQPLTRTLMRYHREGAAWSVTDGNGFLALPPSCVSTPRLHYVWYTAPWQRIQAKNGGECLLRRELPLLTTVVRVLVESAVSVYQPGLTDLHRVPVIAHLMGETAGG